MPVVPGTLNYHDPNDARLKDCNVIIAGRGSVLNNPFYKSLQDAGHRIVQYIDFIDIWPTGPFDKQFCTGAPVLPGGLSNWGGFPIVDLSVKSWRDNLVEQLKWALSLPELDDLMLDVFGTRMWTGAWNAMSAIQRQAHADGARDLASRFGDVRDQYRPSARLYANGTWNGEGHPALCPAIENHDSEIGGGYWQGYLRLPWDTKGQPAGIVYAKSLTAAKLWAQVPGVGVVCIHPSDYFGPSGLALPYATLTPRDTSTPPPPDPTPAPPPSPDPCLDVKAQLAQAQADLATRTKQRDDALTVAQNLQVRIDTAKSALG